MRTPDHHPRRVGGLRALLWLAALGVGFGCVPKVTGLQEVELNLPASFGAGSAAENDLEALRAEEVFDDPLLVGLIDEALRNNKELQILLAEVGARDAEVLGRRGEVFPTVGLGVDVGVEKVGEYTSQGASDKADEILPGVEVPEHLGDFRVDLRASWEIDVWKKLRRATEAARARYFASVEGRRFAVTELVAELAGRYYELVALDRQLAVLDANTGILREALDAVKLQFEAARVTSLAVQRFEAELLKNEARRFTIQQRVVTTENELNALVGRYPQPVQRSSAMFADRPLRALDAGLPSQLLTRRPDVVAAEHALEAARLDVAVARARFFPSLSIDARFGIEAFNPAKLVALPASLLYEAAAQLLAPLLNRSELKADYLVANTQQEAAVVSYEQTVLLAFVDVANQLAAIGNWDHSFGLKAQQVAQLTAAVETSNQLFRAARADYLEVLTTRREALEAEVELIETRQAQLVARVDLYRALGGGWPGADAPTPKFTPTKKNRGQTP
jgi:multidrug efflux system outer membrane protein